MILVNANYSYFQFQALLTSIVLKRNVTMLDIVSTRMLGQFGFLAKVRKLMTVKLVLLVDEYFCLHVCTFMQVFSIFEDLGISVDVVATSEVSISLTLDPSKLWSRELIQQVSFTPIQYFFEFLPSTILLTIYNII